MQPKKNRRSSPRRNHWARRTHRALGLASLVFVALIALSGLVLNHADWLGLANHRTSSALLLRLYGIEPPPIETSFAAGSVVFSSTATALFADDNQLLLTAAPLRGAVAGSNTTVVATAEEFFLMTPEGALIERYRPRVAGEIGGLGVDTGRVIARIGNQNFLFDDQQMTISLVNSVQGDSVAWSKPTIPSAELVQKISLAAVGNTLTWERVLSDLHSGRIVPRVGRFIADVVAICLLYLCISGAIMWTRLRRRGGSSNAVSGVDAK